jgi:hypothetical protein
MSSDYTQEQLQAMNVREQEAKSAERLAMKNGGLPSKGLVIEREDNPTPHEKEVEILKRGEKILVVEDDVEREATEEEIVEILQAEAEKNTPKGRGTVLCAGPPPVKMKDAEGNVLKDGFGKDAIFKRKYTADDRNTPRDTFEDSKGTPYVQMADGSVRRR